MSSPTDFYNDNKAEGRTKSNHKIVWSQQGYSGSCICLQHLLTLYTELAIPVPQSSSSSGVCPGRKAEQMPTSQRSQLLCFWCWFKQSVHELGLKYWGAYAGNNAHIVDRNLNLEGDFSWQILAKFSGLNCKLRKYLWAGWRGISVST